MGIFKFNTMFRGQAVIIEYSTIGNEIDYAVITNDNSDFKHPDYLLHSDWLDVFNMEIYELTENHLKKCCNAI